MRCRISRSLSLSLALYEESLLAEKCLNNIRFFCALLYIPIIFHAYYGGIYVENVLFIGAERVDGFRYAKLSTGAQSFQANYTRAST